MCEFAWLPGEGHGLVSYGTQHTTEIVCDQAGSFQVAARVSPMQQERPGRGVGDPRPRPVLHVALELSGKVRHWLGALIRLSLTCLSASDVQKPKPLRGAWTSSVVHEVERLFLLRMDELAATEF